MKNYNQTIAEHEAFWRGFYWGVIVTVIVAAVVTYFVLVAT